MKVYISAWYSDLDSLSIPANKIEIVTPNVLGIFEISSLDQFLEDWQLSVLIAINKVDKDIAYNISVSQSGRFLQR